MNEGGFRVGGGARRAGLGLPGRAEVRHPLLTPPAQGQVVAFHYMPEEPGKKAIMAAAPQAGRIIRPFCHILGIETPAELVRLIAKQRLEDCARAALFGPLASCSTNGIAAGSASRSVPEGSASRGQPGADRRDAARDSGKGGRSRRLKRHLRRQSPCGAAGRELQPLLS
jgi:hypothetical protein